MTFASLTMILFILPLIVIVTALVPVKRKQDILMLGGLAAVTMTGGFPELILLLLSICGTWLMLRLQPRKTPEHHRRAELWLYIALIMQTILLLLGRLMLTEMQIIPLLICALQAAECMSEYANNRFQVPPLYDFFWFQCDVTRLPAGPVLSYAEAEKIRAGRRVTAESVGQGASWCIRGLFQLVCLGLPMYVLHGALRPSGTVRTAVDAVFALLTFYFCIYYGLRGTSRIGQGIAKMLGYSLPDSFDAPILADSLHDFRRRFFKPLYFWTERVLLSGAGERDAAGYFSRMALLYGGLGFLLSRSGSGVIWGVLLAGLLTAEHTQKQPMYGIPVQARRFLTAILIMLSLGLLCRDSLFDTISFYTSLLGFSGIAMSDSAIYLLRTNWAQFLLCGIGLFPLHRLLGGLPESKILRLILGLFRAAAELFMLLAAYSELLSSYLRS